MTLAVNVVFGFFASRSIQNSLAHGFARVKEIATKHNITAATAASGGLLKRVPPL